MHGVAEVSKRLYISARKAYAMAYRVHKPLAFRLFVVLLLIRLVRVGRPTKDIGQESLTLLIGEMNRVIHQESREKKRAHFGMLPR